MSFHHLLVVLANILVESPVHMQPAAEAFLNDLFLVSRVGSIWNQLWNLIVSGAPDYAEQRFNPGAAHVQRFPLLFSGTGKTIHSEVLVVFSGRLHRNGLINLDVAATSFRDVMIFWLLHQANEFIHLRLVVSHLVGLLAPTLDQNLQ